MRRRTFISLLGGAAAWPLAAGAQQFKLVRIGALFIGLADAQSFKREFQDGMRELGYVGGKILHMSSAPPKEGWIDSPSLLPN